MGCTKDAIMLELIYLMVLEIFKRISKKKNSAILTTNMYA